MKKMFRSATTVLIIAFIIGFTACSNQYDELKKALETDQKTETADKTEKKDDTKDSNTSVEIEENVSYSVEHWLESTDGRTYGLDVKATQTLMGKKGAATTAVAREYKGFIVEEINQQNIKADGSTVVKIYYDRKRITYTFNANGGKWSDDSEQKTVTGLYESVVPAITEPEKTGAQFCDWDTVPPIAFGLEDAVYEAVWLTNGLISYKIEHCLQNIYNDDYTIDTVQIRVGLPGEITQAVPKPYTGFDTKAVTQNTINADGSTVTRVYYDRKNITYTFNLDSKYALFTDNTFSKSITKRYGTSVEIPEIILTTIAFKVEKWNSEIPSTYDTVNRTFTATYEANYFDKITYLPPGTNGSVGTEGTYVYFGVFPQEVYTTEVSGDYSFPQRTICGVYYYLSSENDAFYTKDPYYNYWYRLEPIKWRVITKNYKNTRKALLVAENILIASPAVKESSAQWDYSYIRTYLNNSFKSQAFLGSAQSLIADTNVSSINESSKDKVFLLSKTEIENPEYGFTTEESRTRIPTYYARMKTADTSYTKFSGYSYGCWNNWWWLRDMSDPWYCVKNGEVYMERTTNYNVGVVPAIVVTLPKQ